MEYLQKFIPEGWNTNEESFNFEDLQKAQKLGTIMQGVGRKCDENYNLQVNLGNGIVGIIPRNEMDATNSDSFGFTRKSICKNKVNQFVQFKVKEIYDKNRMLLSRKDVGKEALEWVKNDLQPGMVINGIVKNIRKYGVFIDIGGGISGLLHVEDISVSRIKSPEERFFIGQKIKVVVKYIERDTNRVVLSHKELLGDWEENIQDFQEKTVVNRNCKRS